MDYKQTRFACEKWDCLHFKNKFKDCFHGCAGYKHNQATPTEIIYSEPAKEITFGRTPIKLEDDLYSKSKRQEISDKEE